MRFRDELMQGHLLRMSIISRRRRRKKVGGDLYWIMRHILLPDVWAGNGQTLWILPVIISCNNNGSSASTAGVLCVYLLRQNEGEKHIKVFLEQSTVGPFADVMRRNVALMGPHYTDGRFSFSTGALNTSAKMHLQSTCCLCIHIFQPILQSWPWPHVMKSCRAGSSCSDRQVGTLLLNNRWL